MGVETNEGGGEMTRSGGSGVREAAVEISIAGAIATIPNGEAGIVFAASTTTEEAHGFTVS